MKEASENTWRRSGAHVALLALAATTVACSGGREGGPPNGVTSAELAAEATADDPASAETALATPSVDGHDPRDASAFFRAEGAPDPLACETDGECRIIPLPDEGGCCDQTTPGSMAVAGIDYEHWLDAHRREHCSEVQCPGPAPYRQGPRCSYQMICWQSRCQTACEGVPDESALPFSEISFREAKRRASVAVTGEPQPPTAERQRCAARPMEGVIVLGSFAHDRGCRFSGAFVGETYHRNRREATEAFLATYDWESATASERELMARRLASALLYTMKNVADVTVATLQDGSIRVGLTTRGPTKQRRPPPATVRRQFTIDAAGRLR